MFLINPLWFWTISFSLSSLTNSKSGNWGRLEEKISQSLDEHDRVKPFFLIDVENVRGKTGFAMNHADLLQLTNKWIIQNGLEGCVSMIVDHGSLASGYYVKDLELGIVFAGPTCKADDVIARDVTSAIRANTAQSSQNEHNSLISNLVVVTSDNGLIQRCRCSSSKQKSFVQIWSPLRFLDDLEKLDQQDKKKSNHKLTREEKVALIYNEINDDSFLKENSDDIQLAASLLEKEARLQANNNNNNKTTKQKSRKPTKGYSKEARKIRRRVEQLKTKIGRNFLSSTSIRLTPLLPSENYEHATTIQHLSMEEQTLYSQWYDIMFQHRTSTGVKYKEETKDRVILAERLRNQIENFVHLQSENVNKKDYNLKPAIEHALKYATVKEKI